MGGSGSFGGGGGGGGGGRSIREIDDTVRELRKENFNLKLRIYFLEERLGTSRLAAGSKDDLVQSNYDLKVSFLMDLLKANITVLASLWCFFVIRRGKQLQLWAGWGGRVHSIVE